MHIKHYTEIISQIDKQAKTAQTFPFSIIIGYAVIREDLNTAQIITYTK